jgi:hypothetical protein
MSYADGKHNYCTYSLVQIDRATIDQICSNFIAQFVQIMHSSLTSLSQLFSHTILYIPLFLSILQGAVTLPVVQL